MRFSWGATWVFLCVYKPFFREQNIQRKKGGPVEPWSCGNFSDWFAEREAYAPGGRRWRLKLSRKTIIRAGNCNAAGETQPFRQYLNLHDIQYNPPER
jgi:hypothetical protein